MAKDNSEKRPQINVRATGDELVWVDVIDARLSEIDGSSDKSRAVRYALRRTANAGLPKAGEVGAGKGKITRYDSDDRLDADALFGEGAVAFKVRGDSMRDKGILPGDWVIVREQPPANKGEVVVAKIEGGLVVKSIDPAAKTLYSGKGADAWQHALTADDVVLGVYVGVVRKC